MQSERVIASCMWMWNKKRIFVTKAKKRREIQNSNLLWTKKHFSNVWSSVCGGWPFSRDFIDLMILMWPFILIILYLYIFDESIPFHNQLKTLKWIIAKGSEVSNWFIHWWPCTSKYRKSNIKIESRLKFISWYHFRSSLFLYLLSPLVFSLQIFMPIIFV